MSVHIARAFHEGRRVLRDDGIACVVFAHKSTEGWEALLGGLIRSGLVVTGSWPIETEMKNKVSGAQVGVQKAMLLASIHLVCRPRPADAGVGDWTEVKAAMEKRIREWLPTLVKHGVRGADAIFSCLGPALESYSRYEKVLTAGDREVPLGGDPDAIEPEQRGFLAYVFETLSKEALRQILGDAETEGFEEDSRMTALFLWTLQATKTNGGNKPEPAEEAEDEDENEDESKPKKAKAGFSMPFDTFIRITRPMGIHYPTLEHRVIEIEKGIVRLLPVRERSEQLLGEAATRPGIEITLEDVKQLELGLATQRREEAALLSKPKRGQKSKPAPGKPATEVAFTTLDRLHRAMLLFGLGRSTLLRQVLETELRQSKRFERLALALNALYPDGSDERRMLEGVQAAMRGVR
jgi:putative DNA methylase